MVNLTRAEDDVIIMMVNVLLLHVMAVTSSDLKLCSTSDSLKYYYGFLNAGGDIAELMLDFIEWLTQQDFGCRCILSVRDILSWVNFLNVVCERDEDGFMTMGALEDEEEAEWDLRLDTVTAFIHAACLVYIDGIGSGKAMTGLRNVQGCFFSGNLL